MKLIRIGEKRKRTDGSGEREELNLNRRNLT
jgi:hypothetical protein